jgi:hypothetical protein
MDKKYLFRSLLAAAVLLAASLVAGILMQDKHTEVFTCFADNGSKEYIGMNSEQCSVMKFYCDIGEGYFSDECSCGCRPDESPIIDKNDK